MPLGLDPSAKNKEGKTPQDILDEVAAYKIKQKNLMEYQEKKRSEERREKLREK